VAALLVVVCVGVHYEALKVAYRMVANVSWSHRVRVAIGVVIAFLAHSTEALLFALGWYLLVHLGVTELSIGHPTPVDLIYFSFSTYTSLGYGDIVPLADGRLLAGVESLIGLVLIAWTASFTYLEMRDNWMRDD